MFYEIESINGEKITISCSDDGTVVYSVGKRETKFSLADCSEYIFKSNDGTSQKIICGEDGVSQLYLIMLYGEDRLEINNNDRERHDSLDDMPDKADDTDVVADVLRNIDADDLHKAIRQLKPTEQELIYRLYLDECPITQAEYAKYAGMTENYVKLKVHRIRKKLKNLL